MRTSIGMRLAAVAFVAAAATSASAEAGPSVPADWIGLRAAGGEISFKAPPGTTYRSEKSLVSRAYWTQTTPSPTSPTTDQAAIRPLLISSG